MNINVKLSILACCFIYSQTIHAKLYKCVGENKKISYSQVRCPVANAQKEIWTPNSIKKSNSAPTGVYTKIEDIINTFNCNTPMDGLKKFPSRADLLTLSRDSSKRAEAVTEINKKMRIELGLSHRYKLPAGRSCEYSFSSKSVTVSFNGDRAKGGFLKFDVIHKAAKKLGYPITEIQAGRSHDYYTWKEGVYNCRLDIKDNRSFLSTMTATCRRR